MKPWVTWCIDHKMAFVPYGVLILGAPIFIIAGVAIGIASAFEDWKTDASRIKDEISRRAAAQYHIGGGIGSKINFKGEHSFQAHGSDFD